MTAASASELLVRFCPVMQYDSLEAYFADSPAVIANRAGNQLKRKSGDVIATATAKTGLLDLLGPDTYRSGDRVAPDDYLDETGSDYQHQAAAMHAIPGYAHHAHGRLVNDKTGTRWLQYWFFMYYDDPGLLGIGTHEGDLEMIQLKFGPQDTPVQAVYAQHRDGYRANWDQVELDGAHGDAPVVYCARGSHASMFRRGTLHGRSPIPDHNDAQGPRVRLSLTELSGSGSPWAWWPGWWGSTRAPDHILSETGAGANSPTAPNRHKAWSDPGGFAATCQPATNLPSRGDPHRAAGAIPPTPKLTARRVDDAIRVHVEIPKATRAATPATVTVAVAATDTSSPPITRTIRLVGRETEITIPAPNPGTFEIRGATQTANGRSSDTTRSPL
jgi:hypothetical protein